MRDYERRAIADAAYDAWRSGGDYDAAWNRAEDAIDRLAPLDYIEAEEIANHAAYRRLPGVGE